MRYRIGVFSLLSESEVQDRQTRREINTSHTVCQLVKLPGVAVTFPKSKNGPQNIRLKPIFDSPAVRYGLCLLVASPGVYRWRRVWRGCCDGCRGRRPCSRDVVCGARGPSLCIAFQTRRALHPEGCGPRASRRSGFRVGCESKLFSGQQSVRFQVTRSRGGGDLGWNCRCGRLLVPSECFEVVAHELFVERRL